MDIDPQLRHYIGVAGITVGIAATALAISMNNGNKTSPASHHPIARRAKPANPNGCLEFISTIEPGQEAEIESATTANGIVTFFIYNDIGKVLVRETMQPGSKHIILNAKSLAEKSVPTSHTSTLEFNEPDTNKFERLTVYSQTDPTITPLDYKSDLCPTGQNNII
jgi:hypothetical protein